MATRCRPELTRLRAPPVPDPSAERLLIFSDGALHPLIETLAGRARAVVSRWTKDLRCPACHRWLFNNRDDLVVPLRERSLEILGEKKALHKLASVLSIPFGRYTEMMKFR